MVFISPDHKDIFLGRVRYVWGGVPRLTSHKRGDSDHNNQFPQLSNETPRPLVVDRVYVGDEILPQVFSGDYLMNPWHKDAIIQRPVFQWNVWNNDIYIFSKCIIYFLEFQYVPLKCKHNSQEFHGKSPAGGFFDHGICIIFLAHLSIALCPARSFDFSGILHVNTESSIFSPGDLRVAIFFFLGGVPGSAFLPQPVLMPCAHRRRVRQRGGFSDSPFGVLGGSPQLVSGLITIVSKSPK